MPALLLILSLAISKSFGGDCTKSAIDNRFRRIKSDARLIKDALAKGIDPITLPVGDPGNGQGLLVFLILDPSLIIVSQTVIHFPFVTWWCLVLSWWSNS